MFMLAILIGYVYRLIFGLIKRVLMRIPFLLFKSVKYVVNKQSNPW